MADKEVTNFRMIQGWSDTSATRAVPAERHAQQIDSSSVRQHPRYGLLLGAGRKEALRTADHHSLYD